jgi:hypothetical protein
MTQKREKKSKRITLKSLAAQLRSLPEVEVPETLKPRLLAAIPDMQAKPEPAHQFRWYPAWDFGVTAAAAVLIFALMFLVNYGLSTQSKTGIIEFDTSLRSTTWNQNNFLYDQNNTYLEKSESYELK